VTLRSRKGGGWLVALALALTAGGCTATSTPAATPITPSSFVITWGNLAFPATNVGSTSGTAALVTLWNNGTAAVPVTSVTGTNADEFPWTTTCQTGGSLAAASTCTVTVHFKPSATGSRTGTLTVNANSQTQDLALSGTGAVINLQVTISSAGDTAPTTFLLAVTGATPGGTLTLNTAYTPAPGHPARTFDSTIWTADSNGAVTASINTDAPGTYEHWLVDATSGLSTNHVFHTVP
jgi:hypothetical protein